MIRNIVQYVFFAFMFSFSLTGKAKDGYIHFTVLPQMTYLRVEEPLRKVIYSQKEWEEYFSKATERLKGLPFEQPKAPIIDFDKNILVIANMGLRPEGGYSIYITGVYDHGNVIEVRANEVFPGSCGGLAVQTYPYTAITIQKTDKTFDFNTYKTMSVCN